MKKICLLTLVIFSVQAINAQSGKVRNPETMDDKKNKVEKPAPGTDMPLAEVKDNPNESKTKKETIVVNEEAQDISASNYEQIKTKPKPTVAASKNIAKPKYKKLVRSKKG